MSALSDGKDTGYIPVCRPVLQDIFPKISVKILQGYLRKIWIKDSVCIFNEWYICTFQQTHLQLISLITSILSQQNSGLCHLPPLMKIQVEHGGNPPCIKTPHVALPTWRKTYFQEKNLMYGVTYLCVGSFQITTNKRKS